MPEDSFYTFLPDGVSFASKQAARVKTIYAPLCGTGPASIKSAISPTLSGDIKVDKFHYLTKPASREDLRLPLRDFFVFIKGKGVFSLSQENPSDAMAIEIGPLWHKYKRSLKPSGLTLSAVNFIPVSGENVELMQVTVKNISRKTLRCTPTFAIALFGRSRDNKHDHEHVTALLNRVQQRPEGVLMQTAMAFNEEGHKESRCVYFVFGSEDRGRRILGSFPTVDSFYGDGGSPQRPQAVFENYQPVRLNETLRNGKEVLGALRFRDLTLKAGQSKSYVVMIGMADSESQALTIFSRFDNAGKWAKAWELNKAYWSGKISSVIFSGADKNFDAWMRWVILQPVLRRIFGCSFLPDHDYGQGGRGWRDIWQDLLSLILIEPHSIRHDLINNCAGIRIDGSNATIIGNTPGEFLADRNAITRVWMDHGAWPLLTLLLYIDQTGDFDILLEKQNYFRDCQLSRTQDKDIGWVGRDGHKLLDEKGHVYTGTILEHVLVENLTQFFNVGQHNIIRLEGADWNDGLDMAASHGESVAFTSFYGGNLSKLADLLEDMAKTKGIKAVRLARELLVLLDTLGKKVNYDDPKAKYRHLFGQYYHSVQPALSGKTVKVTIKDLVHDLRAKAQWIFAHIRRQEKVRVKKGSQTYEWFNGYYDNNGRAVEGWVDGRVRMTLTGQVFAIMSGMALEGEIEKIIESAEVFLKDKTFKGYRLNTDFGVRHYLDLGRAFAFAYGTKENGSFFSHMTVMFAAALYQRGFARRGYEVLQSIYQMAIDGAHSKIYPGIPEYFDSQGRGMYHYLTGSASWWVLTQLIYVFGVRGWRGDLILAPQLVKEEFNKQRVARVVCSFAGKRLTVEYHNPKKLDAGSYAIDTVFMNGRPLDWVQLAPAKVCIPRAFITKDAVIRVVLGA